MLNKDRITVTLKNITLGINSKYAPPLISVNYVAARCEGSSNKHDFAYFVLPGVGECPYYSQFSEHLNRQIDVTKPPYTNLSEWTRGNNCGWATI
jgi:hypothetical protein